MKKPGRTSSLKTKKRRAAPADSDGCTVSERWSLLPETAGYVQVWVPVKKYDRVAKAFLRTAKDKYQKKLLRQRTAPLAVDSDCGGTCTSGSGCAWILIQDGGSSKLYVCDCALTS